MLISAQAGEQAVIEGLRHGADDYIVKPFGRDELIARLGTHLELSRLRRDYEAEREALKARDEFLAFAAHELRTPVTSLRLQREAVFALSERGDEHLDTTKLRRVVELMVAQIDRLDELIERLLDTSRIAAGRLELDCDEHDLTTSVRHVVERLAADADRAQCEVRVHAPARVYARFDADRIDQICTNLLCNAFQYASHAPIDVSITTDSDRAFVRVADQGPGIPADQHERIFERMARAVDKHSHPGLGLGLYLAREVATAHGGTLRVESDESRGSTFELVLPTAMPK